MRPLEATTRRFMHVPACVAAVIVLLGGPGYHYCATFRYYATFRAAAFPGRRERSLCLFVVAWEGHQADKEAKQRCSITEEGE